MNARAGVPTSSAPARVAVGAAGSAGTGPHAASDRRAQSEARSIRGSDLHFKAGTPAPGANFIPGRSVYLAGVQAYDLYRSMLYALGAKSVSNKMLAHVDLILHGDATPPKPAVTKYPRGEFIRADLVLPLFHHEIDSFAQYVQALKKHGFTVRNPSDEGDPEFDHFALPLVDESLHATLLHYLGTSPFIADFSQQRTSPRGSKDEAYTEFIVPATGHPWYYRWTTNGWDRVHAQRGEVDYPLEIKGGDLTAVEPALWKQSAGLYFFEAPETDSVNGLFIQAGVDARTGLVHGAAISRVWT